MSAAPSRVVPPLAARSSTPDTSAAVGRDACEADRSRRNRGRRHVGRRPHSELALQRFERWRRCCERVQPVVRGDEQRTAVTAEIEPANRRRPMPNGALRCARFRVDQRDRAAGIADRDTATVRRKCQRRDRGGKPHIRTPARLHQPRDQHGAHSIADGDRCGVGRKRERGNRRLGLHFRRHTAIGNCGNTHHAVAGASNVLPVAAEGDERDRTIDRLCDDSRRRTGNGVPDAHDAIDAARRRDAAVSIQRRGRDPAAMPEIGKRRARARCGDGSDLQLPAREPHHDDVAGAIERERRGRDLARCGRGRRLCQANSTASAKGPAE